MLEQACKATDIGFRKPDIQLAKSVQHAPKVLCLKPLGRKKFDKYIAGTETTSPGRFQGGAGRFPAVLGD